jgi:hypothetical protein
MFTWACKVNAEQGSMIRLTVDVPSGWEPGRAVARIYDANGNPSTSIGVKNWTLGTESNGVQTLVLNFATPLEGKAVVVVPMIWRNVGTSKPELRPPTTDRRDSIPMTYAIRTTGVTIATFQRDGTRDMAPDTACAPWRNIPELKLDREPVEQAVRKMGRNSVVLTPTLKLIE